MSLIRKPRTSRNASSTRLVILLGVLVIVGIGCAYEFSVARPAYSSAWDEIKKIDASRNSSNYTSDSIKELIGEPASVIDDYRDDCVIYTYRWPSGLLVKNHEIHVVFTKLNPLLSKKLAENGDERATALYYYSAVAGQGLDPDANFPKKQNTIVQNLNPPPVSMGGG